MWPDKTQRYAACGPIDAAASHHLTRGTKSFLNREIMRRDSAASHHSTRGVVQLMNRKIRAPKGEILPVPQASWRRNHDTAQIRTQGMHLFDGQCPVSISINAFGRSRLSTKSAPNPAGPTLRLPHKRSGAFPLPKDAPYRNHVFKAVPSQLFEKEPAFGLLLLQNQFNSTLTQADDQPLLA